MTTSSFKSLFTVFHNPLAAEIVNKSYFCLESFCTLFMDVLFMAEHSYLLMLPVVCGFFLLKFEFPQCSVGGLLWDWEGNISRTIKHKTTARTELAG